MKYQSKPHSVEALCFDGTFSCVQQIDDWVSSHDIENSEVTCQGTKEPLALDVTNAWGLKTIEAGDYVVIRGGTLSAERKADFERTYEAWNE